MNTDRKYLSFLLRLWMADEDGETVWRASLESTHSNERYGFASLDSLFEFLSEQTRISGEEGTIQTGSTEG